MSAINREIKSRSSQHCYNRYLGTGNPRSFRYCSIEVKAFYILVLPILLCIRLANMDNESEILNRIDKVGHKIVINEWPTYMMITVVP